MGCAVSPAGSLYIADVGVLHGVMAMAKAEPEAAVLRRTAIAPKYIKADAELQHAATQYFTAIADHQAARLTKLLTSRNALRGSVRSRC